MLKITLYSILIVMSSSILASGGFLKELTVSVGVVNNSVVQNNSGIVTTDTTIVTDEENSLETAKPVSNISLELNWSFMVKKKHALGVFLVAPLLITEGTSFFMGGMRYRHFLYSISSGFEYSQKGITFHIRPSMRYFVGGSVTGGYLIYNTESAKKTDASLNVGLEAGMMYQWNTKYSIDLSIAMIKRTGVVTSGMGMNVFIGMGIVL